MASIRPVFHVSQLNKALDSRLDHANSICHPQFLSGMDCGTREVLLNALILGGAASRMHGSDSIERTARL